MKVISHQAESKHSHSKTLPATNESIDVGLPVQVISKYGFSLVSPRDHVIDRPFRLQP